MRPVDFKDEFYRRDNRKSNNGYDLVGGSLPTSTELIFCEKCITCKYINKMTGECMNANKLNWVDKDCKDYTSD